MKQDHIKRRLLDLLPCGTIPRYRTGLVTVSHSVAESRQQVSFERLDAVLPGS